MFGQRHFTIDTGKTTQFSEAWVLLAILLTVAGLALHNTFLTGAAATLLVIACISWAWNRYSLARVSYTRRFSEIRAFLGEEVELHLEVRNRKPLPLTWLIVRDVFPAGLPVNEQEMAINPATNQVTFSTFWMPGAYQRIGRTVRIQCVRRGFHRFGPSTLHSGDGFGFFEQSRALNDEVRLIVYPRLYSVSELNLPSDNPFGSRRSRARLYEDPLRSAGVREWQDGDEMRRVHWKASAHSQRLLSRVYEASEEHVVQIMLNVATFERHWQGVIVELHERAISVAGSLAALALEQRHAVGLMANGVIPGSDQVLRLLPGRSPNQLLHIMELLAAVTHFASHTLEELLMRETPRLPWGATIVVVTAIAHPTLLAALMDLAAVGRRLVLVTLAEEPPRRWLGSVEVFHLPHLVDDLIALQPVHPEEVRA